MGKGSWVRVRLLLSVLCLVALAVPVQTGAETVAGRVCAGALFSSAASCAFEVGGSRLAVAAAVAIAAPFTAVATVTVSIKHTTELGTTTLLTCSASGLTATGCANTGTTSLLPFTDLTCVVSATPGVARGVYWCSSTP